jgi:hypothetical protein
LRVLRVRGTTGGLAEPMSLRRPSGVQGLDWLLEGIIAGVELSVRADIRAFEPNNSSFARISARTDSTRLRVR